MIHDMTRHNKNQGALSSTKS